MLGNFLSIRKIRVNLGKFTEGTDFQLFQENNGGRNSRVSLIFGRMVRENQRLLVKSLLFHQMRGMIIFS
mgnify:CR=1 FL=1